VPVGWGVVGSDESSIGKRGDFLCS
jgi:hypothetical protein